MSQKNIGLILMIVGAVIMVAGIIPHISDILPRDFLPKKGIADSQRIKSSVKEISALEWEVTLYPSEKWFDTGIKYKKGEKIFVTTNNYHNSTQGVTMYVNKKETNLIGYKIAKFDQTLKLGLVGKDDGLIFSNYRTLVVKK